MVKRLFITLIILSSAIANGQNNTSSPYSYFGVGLPSFNGSAENRSMEGLSISADSIHYNFQNPAALGKLQLTTYTVGLTQQMTTLKNDTDESEKAKSTSFDYLAIAIPTGKFSFALGIRPRNSVGYRFQESTSSTFARFNGKGGLNNLFLALGYPLYKGLNVGVEGGFHFGKIKSENSFYQDNVQYGTKEMNVASISGFQFRVGLQYEREITEKLRLESSASYTPKASLTSKNERSIATSTINSGLVETIVDQRDITIPNTDFDLPEEWRVGVGISQFHKWMVGVEYQNIGKANYKNTTFTPDNVKFNAINIYRVGGYFIPQYNDNNYLNRITYRAGIRYQDTGLNVNQHDIKEFGMSFGLGLPAGPYMSNFNLGVEYGNRGTTSGGLVKENFVNIFIGLSFNDKWFNKRKFN